MNISEKGIMRFLHSLGTTALILLFTIPALADEGAECSSVPNLDTLSTEQQIQLVYTGLLSRGADRPGLAYWLDDFANGFTIEKLRENIVLYQREYLEGLGTLSRNDVVEALYQNLFTRAPEEAGREYWVNGAGATVVVDQLVLALINGAGCTDRKALLNKAAAASYYTENYLAYNKVEARTSVENVDATDASLDAARAYIDDINNGGSASCGISAQKQFVREASNQWYLWYDELADINPDNYVNANAYLRALTAPLAVDGRDPGFSYLTTVVEDGTAITSGAYIGFGFRYGFDATLAFRIIDVFEGGPASDAAVRRSDKVLAIALSGDVFESIDSLAARNASIEDIFGASEEGVERRFRIERENEIFDVTLVKREVDVPAFAGEPLLINRDGNDPIGYVHFRAFTTNAEPGLQEMARVFRDANVSDLVIDLRYNGGGLLSVAEQMLNIFVGALVPGSESYRIAHNDKRAPDYNQSVYFVEPDVSVSPMRIAFIVTDASASASELVINSVDPYIDVVLVGSDTRGKAVGQYAFRQTNCDTLLRLVSFEVLNGEGQGRYYSGLNETGRFTLCPADDDITREFTDPQEDSLSTAIAWLNNSSCIASTKAQSATAVKALPLDWSLANQPHEIQGRSPWNQ